MIRIIEDCIEFGFVVCFSVIAVVAAVIAILGITGIKTSW